MWLTVLLALTVSVFLTLDQRSDIKPISDSKTTTITTTIELDWAPKPEAEPGAEIAASWMKRDHLVPFRSSGLTAGLGWACGRDSPAWS